MVMLLLDSLLTSFILVSFIFAVTFFLTSPILRGNVDRVVSKGTDSKNIHYKTDITFQSQDPAAGNRFYDIYPTPPVAGSAHPPTDRLVNKTKYSQQVEKQQSITII